MSAVKVNLGCGWRDFGKDWHHVDGGDYNHLDSKDIFKLPFEDNTVDLIYASHVIEYFSRIEIVDVLCGWYDKLKTGGILRLGVPNFEVISKLYQEGDYPLDNFLGPLYGRMDMDGEFIYHKTTYDYNSLSKVLYDTGFAKVNHWDWKDTEHAQHDDHSQAYLPHMDKENGTLISLNVECVK
tara:strand:- start:1236 stop:1781 length:546 start_codon:yes stop_codon:yes gene_type:complete